MKFSQNISEKQGKEVCVHKIVSTTSLWINGQCPFSRFISGFFDVYTLCHSVDMDTCFLWSHVVHVVSTNLKMKNMHLKFVFFVFSVNLFRCFLSRREQYSKNMANGKEIHFRAEDEYISMLDFLVTQEETDAITANRIALNKTQIIKQAIKDYYIKRTDKKTSNAFSESIQITLESVLEDYFNKNNAMITGKLKLLQDFVKEINIKELLMLKVLMYSASAEKHLDSVQTAVDNNMKFEEIITEKVKQIMGGNEK